MNQIIKRLAMSITAMLLSWCVYAQPNITRVEYYIDGDPGYGKATALSFTAGPNLVNLAINIDPSTLASGVHILGVRAQDANGAWSLDNRWLFAKPFASDTTGPGPLPNITKVEFYIDGDPGYGKGTALSITAGTNLVNLSININPSTIAAGVHILGTRAQDANGAWSHDNRWLFAKPFASDTTGPGKLPNISRVEYYLDNDPGYGNATTLSISPGTDLSNLTINLDTSLLAAGTHVHVLGVRARDANGVWSLDNRWVFAKPYPADTIPAGPAPNLKRAEYYIDTDPGYGNGIQVAQDNVANLSNISISANISGLAKGNHTLYLRSMDANNAWSLDNKWDFKVGTAITGAAITENSVNKKTMCAGSSFNVGYDAKGTYTAGNTFTVQLSDGTGSFTSPTSMGSITSTALSGIINCALPTSLSTASGYKVRVVSTNPVVTGATGTDALTINALPPVPVITPGGPTTFCQGGSVTLTSSSATSNAWSTGATTQSISVSTSGNYTVTVTNASGCSQASAPTTVTVNPLPTATISASGPTTFCQGGSVTLTASAASSYLWSTGATTQSITVSAAGNYTVTVTSASGCSKTSAVTAVTVNPLPTATITAGGPTTFCQGGSVTLTANTSSSYLWSTGATTQSITVNASGSYTVTVTNANGCSQTSAATAVTVNTNPAPTTSPSGNVSINQGSTVTISVNGSFNSYLWSNGATTSSITTGTAGSYTVTVTNASGCSGTSAPVVVSIIGGCTKPTITASGSITNLCPGQTVKLTSSAKTGNVWSTGATTSSLTVKAAGTFTVTNSTGCTSDPIVVTYLTCANPSNLAAGSITGTSATLSWSAIPCASSYIVNYRKKGTTTFIPDTSATPSVTIKGLTASTIYQWNVTAVCSSKSKSAKITGANFTTSSSLMSMSADAMQSGTFDAIIFPNPAKDNALLQIIGAKGSVSVMLYDMVGRKLWTSGKVNSTQIQLPLADLSNGTYLVYVVSGNENKTLKLIKAN
jgi:hypothetical protein